MRTTELGRQLNTPAPDFKDFSCIDCGHPSTTQICDFCRRARASIGKQAGSDEPFTLLNLEFTGITG